MSEGGRACVSEGGREGGKERNFQIPNTSH